MKRVELTYFKTTGTYYSSSEYETKEELWHKIIEEVDTMKREGNLPGLAQGSGEGLMILVNVEDSCVPHIVF